MTTTSRTPAPVARAALRRPLALHLAAVPLALMFSVTCYGAIFFANHDDPTRPPGAPPPGSWPAWTLAAVLVAYALTALVCVPGIYRGSATAWRVALGVLAAHVLFGLLKLLGLGESAAGLFLAVDVAVAALLLTPGVRRWVGARPPAD